MKRSRRNRWKVKAVLNEKTIELCFWNLFSAKGSESNSHVLQVACFIDSINALHFPFVSYDQFVTARVAKRAKVMFSQAYMSVQLGGGLPM